MSINKILQPKIRFKEFSGENAEAWEQRKLDDLLSERNELILESNEYPLMSFVANLGVVPKGERYDRSFLVKDTQKKYKKTKLGDFIYSSNNLETGSIGFNKYGDAVISPVYSIFKSNNINYSTYIGIISKRKEFINEMIRYRQGVVYGQWKIPESDFLTIKLYVPILNEIIEILKLFKKIDETITLHQRKIEQYQELKKTLLSKMFI